MNDEPASALPELADSQRVVPFEQLSLAVCARRSVRSYKPEAPAADVFDRLLQAARYAPTGCNTRTVHYYAITTPERLARIRELTLAYLKRAVAAEPERLGRFAGIVRAGEKGLPTPNVIGSPALLLVVATGVTKDAHIAATTVSLLAPSLGLATCWAGLVMMAMESDSATQEYLKSIGVEGLALPNTDACALMIGYPDTVYHRAAYRRAVPVAHL